MYILTVVGNYPKKSESFVEREISSLHELGHTVSVWSCLDGRLTTTFPPLRAPLLTKLYRSMRAFSDTPRFAIRYGLSLAKVLQQLPTPDIVVGHFLSVTAPCARAAARAYKCPLVISAHARGIYVPYRPALRAARTAQTVLVCSEAGRRELLRLMPDMHGNIQLIRHGIPPEWLEGCVHERPDNHILSAGRLVPKKGFSLLLKAFSQLLTERPGLLLTLAGSGPEERALKRLCQDLGISDSVHFPGFLSPDELRREMDRATIFCAPSIIAPDNDRDGIPNVILEALARGTPVVANAVGGIPEAIVNKQTGLLVAEANSDALCRSILRLLSNPSERNLYSHNGRLHLRDYFNMTENITFLESTLRSVIAKW